MCVCITKRNVIQNAGIGQYDTLDFGILKTWMNTAYVS